jgi:transketolase
MNTTPADTATTHEAPATETRPYREAFTAYAETHRDVVCVTNDLTASCEADGFRARFPERYFSLGMAEQNLVGVLGGMARDGQIPFYPTFSVFATRRPYEQVAMSIAYPALPVRIIGFLPGLTTPGGVTHQATDDLALMSQLPNMTVLEVGDAVEARTVLEVMDGIRGPVFCRMLRGEVPVLFDEPMQLNRARDLSPGDDVLLISSGVHTEVTMRAAERLRAAGVSAGHLHVSTLKPFDDELVLDRVAQARAVVTAENHLVRGGLGTAVAEMIAERGLGTRLRRVGIRDTFTHGGTREYLFEYYGIDAAAIVRTAGELLSLDADLWSAGEQQAGGQRHHEAVAEGL